MDWILEDSGVILDDEDSLKLSGVIVEDESSDLGELDSFHVSWTLLFKSSKEGEVKTDDLTSAALPLSIEEVASGALVLSINSISSFSSGFILKYLLHLVWILSLLLCVVDEILVFVLFSPGFVGGLEK
jgi:hypothetical protein